MTNVHTVKINKIKIERDDRQRAELTDIDELAASIESVGLLQFPVVADDMTLVAGERRLAAMKKLGWKETPVLLLSELDPFQRQVIELEENIKRRQLHWQDEAKAVHKLHRWKAKEEEHWQLPDTAGVLGVGTAHIARCLAVAEALHRGDNHVLEATSIRAAYNIVDRDMRRKIDTELSQMEHLFEDEEEEGDEPSLPNVLPARPEVKEPTGVRSAKKDILQGNFLEWAPQYSGKRFNFLHCDFPYGINHDRSDQGGSRKRTAYADSRDLYFSLCECLCDNLDKILYPSAHVIFWFSMGYYRETLELFNAKSNLVVNPFPLIWMKSDNKGLLPDPERGPRRIYETALFMSRGDRKIIKAVSNAYAAPTNKAEAQHLSEKPEPVLRHFFRMVVDDLSEMLDPTCGSASAINAAESLGAKRVLGIELDKEHHETACQNVDRARRLRAAEEKLGNG